MSWWRTVLRVVSKVGETAGEVVSVVTHIDNLEEQIMSLKKDPFVGPQRITEMLVTLKAIRSGIQDVRH